MTHGQGCGETANVAVIGGTGMETWPALVGRREIHVHTSYGQTSAPLVFGLLDGIPVLFLSRHGRNHDVAPHLINYRANLKALQQCGVRTVLAVTTVGGINPWFDPGHLCVPDDLIDYTHGRQSTFFDGSERMPVRHIEFTHPYSQRIRTTIIAVARRLGMDFAPAGVMGVTDGPRFETAAEVRHLKHDGCDIVGMTGMPEAALAAELGMQYACLALIVNWAASLGDGSIGEQIGSTTQRCVEQAYTVLGAAVPALNASTSAKSHPHPD